MAKGFIICGVIYLIISCIFLVAGLSFLQPIRTFLLVLSLIVFIPCITIFFRTRLAIKISVIAVSSASFICAIIALANLSGILDFTRSWALSLTFFIVFVLITFYLIGFKGYLKESLNFYE